jgi:3-keto-5-aminohexanoate cleavage enzyme
MFCYPEKILLTVAPVAHKGSHLPPEARNPLSPEEIAADVIGCARAGAAMVHLHVRNQWGDQVQDLACFSRTIDLIRRETDIIIQGSTGGVSGLSLEDRCVSVGEPRTEVASLNMGSVNFGDGVYINTLPDIRFWIQDMQKNQVVPELEVFDFSMLSTVERLAEEGLLKPPLRYNFCLGFKGALPADPRYLMELSMHLPEGSLWGLIHEGMGNFRLLAAALGLGVRVIRVGYEDGAGYLPDKAAASNTVLVEKAAELIRRLGFTLAGPEEGRRMLGTLK